MPSPCTNSTRMPGQAWIRPGSDGCSQNVQIEVRLAAILRQQKADALASSQLSQMECSPILSTWRPIVALLACCNRHSSQTGLWCVFLSFLQLPHMYKVTKIPLVFDSNGGRHRERKRPLRVSSRRAKQGESGDRKEWSSVVLGIDQDPRASTI